MPAGHNQGGAVRSNPSLNAEPGCIKVVDTLRHALQRITLEREVLLRCRHPQISDQHLPLRVPLQTRTDRVFCPKESAWVDATDEIDLG